MGAKLPIDERMIAAARMAMRASVHFDLWWLTASKEGRDAHWAAIDEHWEHMRFLQHGQLVAVVGEVHALLDADKRTINLPDLLDEVERRSAPRPASRFKLAAARATFLKLKKLRNNVFAHRTVRMSYNDVFQVAQMTPDELRGLVRTCAEVSSNLLLAFGCEPFEPTPEPREHYANMLRLLGAPEPDLSQSTNTSVPDGVVACAVAELRKQEARSGCVVEAEGDLVQVDGSFKRRMLIQAILAGSPRGA